MAFLGSLGKAFGISTPEAAQIGASFATGGLLSGIGTTLSSLGTPRVMTQQPTVDVSARPAGVDSPATVSPVSQTGAIHDFGGPRLPQFSPPPFTQAQAPIQAGFGLAAPLMQAGRLLSRPSVGGALTGIGAGLGFDVITDMFGNRKKFVITRKLQREVKKVFMMSGGDIGFVAANSMMLFGKDLNEDQILMVLFKTFKNQGPFVTKAAVRKTAQTIRKMERLTDLKDRLCPPKRAPARRRMPAKSTTITNVR